MAESKQVSSREAIQDSVKVLSYTELLTLYHAIQNNEGAQLNQDLVDAVNTRAEQVLDADVAVKDDTNAENAYANAYLYSLDNAVNTDSYNETLTNAFNKADAAAIEAAKNIEWMRENYSKLEEEWNEASEAYAKATNTEAVSFADAFSDEEAAYNTIVQSKANVEALAEDSDQRADAIALAGQMHDIIEDLQAHNMIGNDNFAIAGFRDENATENNMDGSNGKLDDYRGIGEDEIGPSIGKGIAGNGIGTGEGDGIGDGTGGGVASLGDISNSVRNTGKGADAVVSDTALSEVPEDPAISQYIEKLRDEPAINHIFNNKFYNIPPVPHWAYSVDFIPTLQFTNAHKGMTSYDVAVLLTKSVLTVKLPQREMSSVTSNYKGVSIELPGRATTCGSLDFTFAENESFIVSDVLEQLLKYARQDLFYEFDTNQLANYLRNTGNAELLSQLQGNTDILNATLASYRKYIADYAHQFNILVKLYRANDTKAINDTDEDEYPTYVYFFKGCDLQKIGQFNLDYNVDTPIDIPATFMYQYFEEMSYYEYLLRYGSATSKPPVATDEEMIDFADNMSDLAQLEDLETDLYTATDEEMIEQADNVLPPLESPELEKSEESATEVKSSAQMAYDFINKSKLTGAARKEAALQAGITEEDYAAGQKMINAKYAANRSAKDNEMPVQTKQPKIEASPEVTTEINRLKANGYETDQLDFMAQNGMLTKQAVQERTTHETELATATKLGTSVNDVQQMNDMIKKLAPGLAANMKNEGLM